MAPNFQNYRGFSVQALGLPELEAALKQLPAELEKKVLAQALRQAGKPMVSALAAKAPTRQKGQGVKVSKKGFPHVPGELKQAFALTTRRPRAWRGLPDTMTIGVAVNRIAYYWRFLEFGERARNYPAQPFIRDTAEQQTPQVLSIFAKELRDRIPKIWASLRKGVS